MTSFVRKSLVVISATCAAAGQPLSTQPTNGLLVLRYRDMNRKHAETSIALTAGSAPDYVWTASWDSSATIGGKVEWVAYFSGGVQGSQEDSFFIEANDANDF